MNYEERVVVFLDILGFKNFIDDTLVGDSEKKVEDAVQMFSIIRKVFDMDDKHWRVSESLKTIQFSDSIILSFKVEEENEVISTLNMIQYLIMELLRYGLLVRGVVTNGLLYHDDKIIFGPAVVEAVEKEKKAIYPRVILSKDIFKIAFKYRSKQITTDEMINLVKEIVKMDFDGELYLDYLISIRGEFNEPYEEYYFYLKNLRILINKNLINKSQSIVEKYKWLRSKYNQVIDSIKDDKFKNLKID